MGCIQHAILNAVEFSDSPDPGSWRSAALVGTPLIEGAGNRSDHLMPLYPESRNGPRIGIDTKAIRMIGNMQASNACRDLPASDVRTSDAGPIVPDRESSRIFRIFSYFRFDAAGNSSATCREPTLRRMDRSRPYELSPNRARRTNQGSNTLP